MFNKRFCKGAFGLLIPAAAFAALTLALALTGCKGAGEGNAGPADTPATTETAFIEDTPDAAQTFIETTLYFISDEGYVVPVKKLIPGEQGIARACLGYMTSTPVNDAAAAAAGMRTVLPAGTKFDLVISGGEAKLDFISLAPFASAEAESAMLDAVVNTLTGFATVDCVTVTKNGLGGRLENGTELPVRTPGRRLNTEQSELAVSSGSVPGTLYFPNESGALTVPVTRYFGSEPSVYTLVSALIEGPAGRGLMCCFPNGTLLLGAAIENGVLTVNLSDDFCAVSDTEGMYSLACDTLLKTVGEAFGAERVAIQVNGMSFSG